ncbi:unnamed protein product [Hymenolepis diminuta]|uniref:Clathrin_bdg domain-containing protein n=1 Tax=Hymenolepis diminuta TaxID=6216 RepID=A0A0R3SIC8_HYMDI|nr:unnamed protein product [Hymenolepis diminuta]VUZ51011.1 unnamed protein product [Hymenolepis diminuta]
MNSDRVGRTSEISGFSLLHIPDTNIPDDLRATRELQSLNRLSVELSNGLDSNTNNEGPIAHILVNEFVESNEKDSSFENAGGNKLMSFVPVNSTGDGSPLVTEGTDQTQHSFNVEEIENGTNPMKVMKNLGTDIECEGEKNELEPSDRPVSNISIDVIRYDLNNEAYADHVRKANTNCQCNNLNNATSKHSGDDADDFEDFATHEKETSKPVFPFPGMRESEDGNDFEDFTTPEKKEQGKIDAERDKQGSTAEIVESDISVVAQQSNTVTNVQSVVENAQESDDSNDSEHFTTHNERQQDEISDSVEKDRQGNGDNEISSALNVHEALANEYCDDDDFDDFSGFKSADPPENLKATNNESERDDFADFSGFQNVEPVPPLPETSSLIKNILSHIGSALDMTFSTDKRSGLETFTLSQNSPNSSRVSGFLAGLWHKSSSETVENLLTSLSNHPISFATQQVWNTSYTYSMYLETIGVDIQSTHPVISNQIKLLEPTPVVHNSISPSPAPPTTTQSTESPAPDFHWPTNGLSSDLLSAESVKSASDADLEFFEELPSKSSSKPTGPIADLEAELLHSVIPPPPVIKIPAPSLPASILSKISTTSENRIPENVSNVLKQLPDFSYLRKSILAFPVLEQTE